MNMNWLAGQSLLQAMIERSKFICNTALIRNRLFSLRKRCSWVFVSYKDLLRSPNGPPGVYRHHQIDAGYR